MEELDDFKLKTQLPHIQLIPSSWSDDVEKEICRLRLLLDTFLVDSSQFQRLSDQVDLHLVNLRTPTTEEIIDRRIHETKQHLLDTVSLYPHEKPESEFILQVKQDESPNSGVYSRKNALFLVRQQKPINWNETQILFYNRLTIPLETYRLTHDFNDTRFRRHFVSYNFLWRPQEQITKQLEQINFSSNEAVIRDDDTLKNPSKIISSQENILKKRLIPKLLIPTISSTKDMVQKKYDVKPIYVPCGLSTSKRSTHKELNESISTVENVANNRESILTAQQKYANKLTCHPEMTTMITVSFYHPLRGLKLAEFVVPDYQTLQHLKDAFMCDEDFTPYAQKYKSSFFFINGIFYYDNRTENSLDICTRLYKHLTRVQPDKLNINSPIESMESAILRNIKIPFYSSCAYVHIGDCEHRIMFTSIGRWNSYFDSPYKEAYPLCTYKPTTRVTQCQVCLLHVAQKYVIHCIQMPQSVMQLCNKCFQAFFNEKTENADFLQVNYTDIDCNLP